MPTNHRAYPWLAGAAGLIMLARLAVNVSTFSPTIDEPCNVGSAVSMVEAHKLIAPASHPPLARWVAALPLWLDGARLPECRGVTRVGKEDLGYALGTRVLYQGIKPMRVLLAHARLAMLIFPALTLFFLYLFGRYLVHGLAALAAVIFCSVDPTILGHGFWVGTDAAAAAGFTAAIYFGVRWLRCASRANAIGAGLAIGLAASCKYSCLIAIPALLVVALSETRRPWAAWRRIDSRIGRQLALAAAVAFTSLWMTYQFNFSPLGDQDVLGHPAQWENLPRFVRNTPVPMPSFFLGLARLVAHNHMGHAAYLNGSVRSAGWWYYFPEVLALKSSLGFLAALALAASSWVIGGRKFDLATRATLIPAGIFLAVSMTSRIDIGIRYLLPMIPLLYLFVASQLTRPKWVWALMFCMAVGSVETAVVHPDYLSFFNVAAGGAPHGERFALDSNLDWGQDGNRLADWLRSNSNGRPYAIRLSGRRNKPLLKSLGLDEDALEAPVHGRLLCISKNVRLLEGKLPWLSHRTPMAIIGNSIEVYDLTGPAQPGEREDTPILDEPPDPPGL